jgi:hypothetical protein
MLPTHKHRQITHSDVSHVENTGSLQILSPVFERFLFLAGPEGLGKKKLEKRDSV